MLKTKKGLSTGLKQELIEIMRPGVPVQDTSSGLWSSPAEEKIVRNFAAIEISATSERFGSKEYQPFDTIKVTLYSPVRIDTHDVLILGGARWNIAGIEPIGNGEVTLTCTPY